MIDATVYTVEGTDYYMVEKIQSFLYLSDVNDEKKMMIRKIDSSDDSILLPLQNDEEYEKALLLLTSKKLQEIDE